MIGLLRRLASEKDFRATVEAECIRAGVRVRWLWNPSKDFTFTDLWHLVNDPAGTVARSAAKVNRLPLELAVQALIHDELSTLNYVTLLAAGAKDVDKPLLLMEALSDSNPAADSAGDTVPEQAGPAGPAGVEEPAQGDEVKPLGEDDGGVIKGRSLSTDETLELMIKASPKQCAAQLRDHGFTLKEIGELIGCAPSTVSRWLKEQ